MEKDIELIAKDHEFCYYQLVTFFNLKPDKKVGSYIYTSAKQKKRLMGAKYTDIEDAINREIHINYSSSFPHPVLKHELAHLFASYIHPIWRVSLKIGLHEGIAVAADWNGGRLTVHQWSKAMKELNIAPPMEKIMGAFGFWTESSSRSYTLAGSFVRFLVDTYGIEKFKKVFPTGDFKKHYGKELKNLVGEWEEFLKTVPLSPNDLAFAEYRFKSPSIFEKPCAHERAELDSQAWNYYNKSNYEAAIRTFQKIYNLHISDDYDREMSAKLESLRHPEFADKMRDVLISNESSSFRMLTLKEILENYPDFSLAHYLIGRQLHFEKKYARSIEYLKKAEDLGLPDESLTFENYRLIGVNYFYIGEYQKAIDYFNKIAKSRRPMGEVNRAKDWIQRCKYENENFLNF